MSGLPERFASPGRARRRVWSGNGRVHLEVRGLSGPQGAVMAGAVEEALEGVPGVLWAQVDPMSRRVVVQVVDDTLRSDELADVVGEVERICGVAQVQFSFDGAEHPGDCEPLTRHVLALGADVAGLGVGFMGRALRATPLPVELASIGSFVDNEPRIRRVLEAHLGTPTVDLGLAVTNAVAQSLTQGPLGLVADGVHRINLLLEVTARRDAFNRAERRRWGDGPAPHPQNGWLPQPRGAAPVSPTRPDPQHGPVERYADRAGVVGVAAAAATFVTTGSPRRAAGVLVAAIPKAARLGREAFAAHLDRALCERDLLVLDQRALRRLDRVDTVVIDGTLLATGRAVISGVRLLDDADPPAIHLHLSSLFDPANPETSRRRGRWSLGPPNAAEKRRRAVRQAREDLGTDRTVVVRYAGQPAAVAGVVDEPASPVLGLLGAARRQGLMVVVSEPSAYLGTGVGGEADLVIAGGVGLAGAIRGLQADGCVVALVAPGGPASVAALQSADVALELPSLTGAAWSGHILLNEVHDAAFVLDAIASAREISRQSVALSATGSGTAALLALGAVPGRAAVRASSAVNLAALVAMANGLRAVTYLRRHGGRVSADLTRWHELDADEVLRHLGSTREGLSRQDAGRRQRSDADVQAPEPSLARSLLGELVNPLTPVLAGGAVAAAAVGSPADGGIIAGVSALNALVGGLQRYGAERAIAALSEASQAWVTVLRPGEASLESSDSLVPGDVVILRAGDAVPADCRLLDAAALEVDESSLTGESDTVNKDLTPTYSAVLAERSSMLYEGTTIAAGEATAVVVAVGADTVSNAPLTDVAARTSAIGVEARLHALTSLTLPVAGAAGGAVLGLGLLRGRSLHQSVGSAVALAVAAVPEGLPVLATMAQLASARRLSRRQALVRNPRAIEALGRVRVLCTDKTGTLTEGRIRLRAVSDGTTEIGVDNLPVHMTAIVAAGLRASPHAEPGGRMPHLTDQAVVSGAARSGIGTQDHTPGWQRVAELPFEPARGYHATLGATAEGALVSVKGAPETILPRCRTWATTAGPVPLDLRVRRLLDCDVDGLARRGLRILAVAEGLTTVSGTLVDDDVKELCLLGFLVLSDPVRDTAAQAVRDLRAAGVDVLMVTGDHPSTARGVATELGILDGRRVVTGAELASMTDRRLDDVITSVSVFARVTPADKVRVVLALQRRGAPVAMTGDGANDAPAIRLADVGIALGDHATPAARRAADLVVTDERIETIVDAITEGRAMWASLREALAILLGGNLGEVAFTVAATAVTGRAPLTARQLLVVNLLTDVAPALAIALRPPRAISPETLIAEGPDTSLGDSLERAIAIRAASTALGAGVAWGAASLTGRRQRASTIALVALVGSQLGQTITIGGRDPLVLLAGVGSAALLAGIVQTPGVSQFFGCTPLGPVAWSTAVASSLLATVVAGTGNILLTRHTNGPNPTAPAVPHTRRTQA